MAVITISRSFGSGGDEIALQLCQLLDYHLFDKQLVVKVASDAGYKGQEIFDLSDDQYQARGLLERLFGRGQLINYTGLWLQDMAALYMLEDPMWSEADLLRFVQEAVRLASRKGNMIILGRGGQVILKNVPSVFHIRIDAPVEIRIQRVAAQIKQQKFPGKDGMSAIEIVRDRDAASAEYIRRFYHTDWANPLLYHMLINTGKLSIEQAVEAILTLVKKTPVVELSFRSAEPSI